MNGITTQLKNLPFRVGLDGKSYPYKPDDLGYTSTFPLGFQGCFKYGKSDHWSRNNCPMKDVEDKTMLSLFFKELRIHRPEFKAKEQARMVRIIHSLILRLLPRLVLILFRD